jgi:hypothetical protein
LEEDTVDAWYAVLAVDVILVDESTKDSSRWVVWQKSYRFREQCQAKGPENLAEAMSRAAAAFSQKLSADIYDGMARRLKQNAAGAAIAKLPGS